MKGEDLRFLAERAETVVGRTDQRLAEVHARIKSVRRRRAAAVAASASAAVLAVALGIAVLTGPTGSNRDNGPVPPADSRTTAPAAPAASVTRAIVYGEGWPIRTIHVGDRTVDIGDLLPSGPATPVYLNTTDDGVVLTVDTDESRIWFTNGTDVVPIGQVGVHTHLGSSRVVTGTSSSLAAWPDRSGGSWQLVVYDTARRVEVARIDCPRCGSPEVVGSRVYWAGNETLSSEPTTMFDAASGKTRRVPATAYAEDLASRPRGLIVGSSPGTATVSSGYGQVFRSDGRRLTPVLDLGPSSPGRTRWGPTTASDTGSGRTLDLMPPANSPTNLLFSVFDWLDDDRLALVQDDGHGGFTAGDAQILVCRISTQQCRIAVLPPVGSRWVANRDLP